MAILPIRLYGDPILRQKATEVESVTDEIRQLVSDMVETMHGASGIGLAAPQVGRTERLFVVDISAAFEDIPPEERPKFPPQPMVFINPVITWESEEREEFEEGCLSIPELRENVVRPEGVGVVYRDVDFMSHEIEADVVLARVIQHELDHLDGVLFFDHISAFRRGLLKRRLKEIARGEVETDYPVQTA